MSTSLSQRELAERLGVTTQTIVNWGGKGLPRSGDGRYPWAECFAWFLDMRIRTAVERAKPAGGDGEDAYQAARTRRAEAAAKLAELEVAKALGEVIPTEMHERRLALVCERLRAKLLNLAPSIAPRLVALETPAEALLELEPAVHDCMAALVLSADDLAALREDVADLEGDVDDWDEDDEPVVDAGPEEDTDAADTDDAAAE